MFSFLLIATALAQSAVPFRRIGVHWAEGVPRVSFSARDLANGPIRQKLASGLPQLTVMRIYAYVPGRSRPIAVEALSCRIVYDLWDETFRVQRWSTRYERAEVVRSLNGVLDRCLAVRRFGIGKSDAYARVGGREIYFAVLVELNPMSPETVHRIRRWLARPAAGSGLEGDAFFGSFVSLFVNRRIGEAERTVQFRSQRLAVP